MLSNILSCSICLNHLNQPSSLSCGHTMCKGCIEQMLNNQQNPNCPLCRKPTFAPLSDTWAKDEILMEITNIYEQNGENALIKEFPQLVMCLDCGLTPIKPVVLCCQHLFCEACIEIHLQNDLICPACNEWATFLPNTLQINRKYQELIEWYENKNSDKMDEEINQLQKSSDIIQQKSNKSVCGMPVFFFDQLVQIKEKFEIMMVEKRYLQLLKIVSNGSGHFPIITLVDSVNSLPMYGDMVQIQKAKIITNQKYYTQVVGTNRILLKDIYTYDQNGSKLEFTTNLYRNLPGQLWMSNFDIIEDNNIKESIEQTMSLWHQILTILSGGFDELSPQMKELFLPTFQVLNIFQKTNKNKDKFMEQLSQIEEASLVLLRLLRLPFRQILSNYYYPCLINRLQFICSYFEQIKLNLVNLLVVDKTKLKNQNNLQKNIITQDKLINLIRLPVISFDDEEDNQNNQLLSFKNLTLTEQIFMNMFKIEKVVLFIE